ncbi:DUF4269 domain-containing protein [Paenibacillus sp. GYB003]|uniref:DUF4269 domain-containing protein n=1 Tax=Paenibacillus sp. GYB003 TaxID=2994392 RepID=UPI002F969023
MANERVTTIAIRERNWFDAGYLKDGTPVQRKAYDVLTRYGLLAGLKRYDPAVVGTIPIGIDIEGSDLDIVCEAADLDAFERSVRDAFGGFDRFSFTRKPAAQGRKERAVARFACDGLPVELYAESTPVASQNGFVHMVVEARLLELFGDRAKEAVLSLKRGGMKTEPAFAAYFGLAGDPYEALLKLAHYTDDRLLAALTINDIK